MTDKYDRPRPAVQATEGSELKPAPKISRRSFLQGAMLSAAAIGGAGAIPLSGPGKPAAENQNPRSRPAPAGTLQVTSIDPEQALETWIEPWVWRPGDWPGQQLHLYVVENENPGPVIGFGNPSAVLFSYGSATPGPTIRLRGDETLYLKLRNLLSQDLGQTAVGPSPDPNELTPELDEEVKKAGGDTYDVIPADLRQDFCLGEHTNGVHSAHITNLHTHGLHVRPGRNPDGTHSDNVILRLLNQADFRRREQAATDPACQFLREPEQTGFLRDDEQTGEADYEFRIGNVMRKQMAQEGKPPQSHPPGTHWYHPHAHGATHNQVASGMAGFLIVEGDVDEAINEALTNLKNPDPELRTGPYDYRERLMFIQRVFVPPSDPDAPTQALKQNNPPSPIVNGNVQPATITMRPGAVERWRILNGSVDGRGFKRFMVLEGQYVYQPVETGEWLEKAANYKPPFVSEACQKKYGNFPGKPPKLPPKRLQRLEADGSLEVITRPEVEAAKQPLYQLAMDGVTLVTVDPNNQAVYTIKDLSRQNEDSQNPLANPDPLADNPNQDALLKYQNVFKDGQSIKNCYVRPNEVYLGPANRADVYFKAPQLPVGSSGQVYTVFAQAVVVHADTYQQKLQQAVNEADSCKVDWLLEGPEDIIVGYIVVRQEEGQEPIADDFDVMSLVSALPQVPPYLQPISEDELRVGEDGPFRSRTITYSGWGAQDYPLVSTASADPSAANFQRFIDQDQGENNGRLENLVYAQNGQENGEPVYVLLPAAIRTMAIDGRKFDPSDPQRPRMLVESAEEWALYNYSTLLWGNTNADPDAVGTDPLDPDYKQPVSQFKGHYLSYPISRRDGQDIFAENPSFQIVTKGVDHPFHIHQNPFWVMRIEIPDGNGQLHNILDEPRWQDVVWIPRHGGRVVYRSRFPDYVGAYVNHCHILLHEDNGMMQVVEITPFEDQANYETKTRVASFELDPDQVTELYPRLSPEEAFRQSSRFVDPNPTTGQTYPGFEVVPPRLEG